MITLTSPITISPSPVNGKPIKPTTLTSIDYSVSYDNSQQQAIARIKGVNVNLVLWDQHSTPPYSSVGQFTDIDTDNRISTLLNVAGGSSGIESAILALYPPGAKPVPAPQTIKSTPSNVVAKSTK